MIKKLLSDQIDRFMPLEIQNEFPMYKKFILAYLDFLDQTIYKKISNILLNNDSETMYSELLDNYVNQFFHNMINIEKYGLTDDNKRLYIELSKIIIGLKGTRKSTEFLFNALDDFEVFGGGVIPHVDDYVYSVESDSWEFDEITEMRKFPFAYRFDSGSEFPTSTLIDIIKNIHPLGFNFDFIVRNNLEEKAYVDEKLKLIIEEPFRMDGSYIMDGTKEIGEIVIEYDDFVSYGVIPLSGLTQMITCIALGSDQDNKRYIDYVGFSSESGVPDNNTNISIFPDEYHYSQITNATVFDNMVTFEWFLDNEFLNENLIYNFGLVDSDKNNLVCVRYKSDPFLKTEKRQFRGFQSITFTRD